MYRNLKNSIFLLILVITMASAIYFLFFYLSNYFVTKEREQIYSKQQELIFLLEQEKKFFNQCKVKGNNQYKEEKEFLLSVIECLADWTKQDTINSSVGILYLKTINKYLSLEPDKEKQKKILDLKFKVIQKSKISTYKEAKEIFKIVEIDNQFCSDWKILACKILKKNYSFKDSKYIKESYIDFWLKQIQAED